MKTYFNNKKQSGTYAPRSLLTTILAASVGVVLAASLLDCSSQKGLFTSGSGARLQLIPIPMKLEYQAPQATNLELTGGSSDGSLGLLATASTFKVEVSGCITGYTYGGATGNTISTVVNLYNGDRGCIVKLHRFDLNSTTYSDATTGGTGVVPFTVWDGTQVATFSNAAPGVGQPSLATNLISVFITTPLSNPVSTSSSVVYKFTDVAAGTTNTLAQSAVSTAVPLSAVGKDAPNYAGSNTVSTGGVAFARYISTNTDGSGNMSFTIACTTPVLDPGADTLPPFTCTNVDGSGDIQDVAIRYALVPDTYSACKTSATTLTVANANAIFSGTPVFTAQTFTAVSASKATAGTIPSPGTVGQILATGADNSGNSGITNGGFCTVPMLTGATPIYSGADVAWANGYQYLNDLLILQRRDASTNILSYLYYCINIAAITQS